MQQLLHGAYQDKWQTNVKDKTMNESFLSFSLRVNPEPRFLGPFPCTFLQQSLHAAYQDKWLTNVEDMTMERVVKTMPTLQPEAQVWEGQGLGSKFLNGQERKGELGEAGRQK